MKKILLSLLAFCCLTAYADSVVEGFESVVIVDADGNEVSGYTLGTGLSNGWTVIGGNICQSIDYSNFSLWSTAYAGSKSLTAQAGSTNNAVIVIPVKISGTISFYARKTSSSSSTKGYVDLFEMEENGSSFKKASSSSFKYWTLTSTTWTKYEFDLGSTPRYIGISLIRAGLDEVTYNPASTDPHEHSYSLEWSTDFDGHWHACTSETGYCDTPKGDYAAHDGSLCSVCGYKTPGIESFPWTEDFEDLASGIPEGWSNSEGTVTSDSRKWGVYSSYADGKVLRFDSYNNNNGLTNILATPLLYIPSTGIYELRFKVKNPKGGDYSVKITEYGQTERATLIDNLTGIAAWEEKTVSLEAYAGKAVKIYFCGTSNYGSGDAYLYLDDVIVKERIAHNHDYSEVWSHDLDSHWHACNSEIGECDAPKIDQALHILNADNICTICGYERPFTEDFENGIPELWTNNGWTVENAPSYGNGTKMAYAGRYAAGNTLTTPRLQAKNGEVIEVQALLPWDDETLLMEYSTDGGETWNTAFAETPANNNTLCTLSWTAPADGVYLLRFSGRYNYIDNISGFKLAPIDVEESVLPVKRWATLCYPADVDIAEGAQAFIVTDVTAGTIEMTEVTGTIPASTPVLVYSPAFASLTLPAASYVLSTTNPVRQDGNLLVGCYCENTLNKSNQYVLQQQDDVIAFYRINPAKPLTTTPYRCYLEVDDNSSAKFSLIIDDSTTTSINTMENIRINDIYDLNGRKVDSFVKNRIYIVGNKKIIVK